MDVWRSVYHLRVVTLHIITQLLRSTKLTIVARDLKGKFDKGILSDCKICLYILVVLEIFRDYICTELQ